MAYQKKHMALIVTIFPYSQWKNARIANIRKLIWKHQTCKSSDEIRFKFMILLCMTKNEARKLHFELFKYANKLFFVNC